MHAASTSVKLSDLSSPRRPGGGHPCEYDPGEIANYVRPEHLADLRASGLTDETIAAAGIRSTRPGRHAEDANECLNWSRPSGRLGPCLCFPFFDSAGKFTRFVRVKPNRPRKAKGGKPAKYETPKGSRNRVYIPAAVRRALAECSVATALFITEGEKKALEATQEGFPTLGLVGVYGWVAPRERDEKGHRIGPRELQTDLAAIRWRRRVVYLAFDSDAATNPNVKAAEEALAEQLRQHGADVRIIRLQAEPDGAKNGMDDFLVRHGRAAFQQLVDRADFEAGLIKATTEAVDATEQARAALAPNPACECQNPYYMQDSDPETGISSVRPFGCHSLTCSACRQYKIAEYLERIVWFMLAECTTHAGLSPGEVRKLYVAEFPDSMPTAIRKQINDAEGAYVVCRDTALESRYGPISANVLVALPPAAGPLPESFTAITPADAVRWFVNHAGNLQLDPDAKRQRPITFSRNWPHPPTEEEVSGRVFEGRAVITSAEAREITTELGIACDSCSPVGPSRTPQPARWKAPAGRALALRLLFGGVGLEHRPSVDRIRWQARTWFRVLPADLGDGQHVRELLLRHLWFAPPADIVDELRVADAADRQEATACAEGRRIRNELTSQWIADLEVSGSEPVGLIAEAVNHPHGLIANLFGVPTLIA